MILFRLNRPGAHQIVNLLFKTTKIENIFFLSENGRNPWLSADFLLLLQSKESQNNPLLLDAMQVPSQIPPPPPARIAALLDINMASHVNAAM